MKKLLTGTQVLTSLAFFVSQVQTDPLGAAVLAVLSATAFNLVLGFVLTNKRFGGADEFNGPFSVKKLGAFLENDYAVKRLAVLAVALFGTFFTSGMTQQGLADLFIAGAAAQLALIVADNSTKLQAVLAGFRK